MKDDPISITTAEQGIAALLYTPATEFNAIHICEKGVFGLQSQVQVKLQAEQEAERMQFVIAREKLEAERKRIEAEGVRNAQKITADGLTEPVLRARAIEAFKQLATSPNAKVIITDGRAPLVMPQE